MSQGHAPSVFVSSTCYDLAQIRHDIKIFLESLGLNPILSEYNAFPVDPDLGTIDNCLRLVDSRADLFVLLVGGRYGSVSDGGKSVTNHEYLRARAKGIPIYVFVHKSILNVLPVWQSNPTGDFSAIADSPKVFEFVSSLKGPGDLWVFPFERAQDITETLRVQFAHLFMDALDLRTKSRRSDLTDIISKLRGRALRLVIERPLVWEHRFFSQVLADELAAAKSLGASLEQVLSFLRFA